MEPIISSGREERQRDTSAETEEAFAEHDKNGTLYLLFFLASDVFSCVE